MIGNDIIDRQAVLKRSPAHWERFRKKIMTLAEQDLLAEYRKNNLDIWLAWAVKESVYKLEYQSDPKRYFAPKAIAIQSFQKASGRQGTYPIQLGWNKDYIHALAWTYSAERPNSVIYPERAGEFDGQIISHLESKFPTSTFCVEKEHFPQIKVDQTLFWPLSKSHHGRWIAFAYQTG